MPAASIRGLIRVSTRSADHHHHNIYLQQQAQQQSQAQTPQLLLAHVGDLLEHSWHYDCVVSPKSNNVHSLSTPPMLHVNTDNIVASSSTDPNVGYHAQQHGSSSSSSSLAQGAVLSKPLSIIQYPSLSSRDSGYVSLAAFIHNQSSSSGNSLSNNNILPTRSPSSKLHSHRPKDHQPHHHGRRHHHHHIRYYSGH